MSSVSIKPSTGSLAARGHSLRTIEMSAVFDAQFVAGGDVFNRSEHGKLQAIVKHGHHVGRFILGRLIYLSSQTAKQADQVSKKQQPTYLAGDEEPALILGCVQR